MDEDKVKFGQYCLDNVFNRGISEQYIHWFLIPAVGIVIALSFLEKRKLVKPDLWHGRPATVRPLSFLDDPRNRWGIILVFGSITGQLIGVTQKTFGADFPTWAKIFLVYILCIETSILCYPLFACMTSRHKLVGSVVGLLYATGWFIFEMFATIQIGRCYTSFTRTDLNVNIAAHIVIQEFPVMLCNFLVVLKFIHKLYKCITKRQYKISVQEQYSFCRSYHLTYAKHVLRKQSTEPESLSLKNRLLSTVVKPVPGFRFPLTILITACMSVIMLYMVGLYCAEFMEIQTKQHLLLFLNEMTAANVIATIITFLSGFRNIYNFVKNYRRDMLCLYKGDRSFIPDTVTSDSPNVYMARGMRFIGTAIVGSLWGTVFCYLVVFCPLAACIVVFRYLKETGNLEKMYTQFEWIMYRRHCKYPVCMILIFQLQTFLIGRCFIQHSTSRSGKRYTPLAVDNRNMFDIVSFFMLFLNASIGIFAFLKRILVGALMGVFLIPRMDRSLLMRGYESMDKCYVNYIGMIMVDFAHNNPLMRVFCHVVTESAARKRQDRAPLESAVENPVYSNGPCKIPQEIKNTVARRRWYLAYTLVRNPSLVSLRKNTPADGVADPTAVTCSVDDDFNDTDNFICRRWKKRKSAIPRNLTTNIMALLVLLAAALLYAGLPLVIDDIVAKTAQSQMLP